MALLNNQMVISALLHLGQLVIKEMGFNSFIADSNIFQTAIHSRSMLDIPIVLA